ncbi:MAG: hypothetical protein NZM18_13690, partial [Thermoflexales bacterium]|nr:hypothetical protein [Thermoflexales bacterium]
QVERRTRCVMSWQVALSCDEAVLQAVANQALQASQACTDGFIGCAALDDRGRRDWAAPGKSADLRG